MGLDIYLDWKGMTEEEDEARYTGFVQAGKVGYLRSSYNPGGFNSWADTYNKGFDFYFIFQPQDDNLFKPNWYACEERRKIALEQALKASPFRVIEVSFSSHFAKSPTEALSAFEEEQLDPSPFIDSWYSSNKGMFFNNKPVKVLSVITGENCIGSPCAYLICDMGENPHEYFINILKNEVKDFIELGIKKNGWIVWSS